jgi:hypothetical protein
MDVPPFNQQTILMFFDDPHGTPEHDGILPLGGLSAMIT